MSSRIPTLKFVPKAVAAIAICGAAIGTGGAAFASTSTTSGSTTASTTPAVSGHATCTRAPKALAKITKVEGSISKRLPKLQAAETKMKAKGHTKGASFVAKRINRLQKVDTKAASLAKKIEARCPSGTAS